MPHVSVIIPYYRGERFIAATLDSLLAASEALLEILVVSDGSPEESLGVLRPYAHRITLLTQENAGQASARNRGIEHARGEFIALVDQDDLWPPGRQGASLAPLLEDPELDYVRGLTEEFTCALDGTATHAAPSWQPSLVGAALYRRRVFDAVGLFDPALRAGEDFDWNTRLNESTCRGMRLETTTLYCRKHAHNQSSAAGYIKAGQMLALKKKLERARSMPTS